MIKNAFVFPGQGSQSVGMMTNWRDYQPVVIDVYAQASEALGYDLWQVVSEGPAERLNATEITQPAMLCAGIACWQIMQQNDAMPGVELMAGHSLGEYTALVCAQSLDITSAVKLVAKRGSLMQSAVAVGEGAMAAIIGLSDEAVLAACSSVESGIVEAVNFNAPGQVVIAGQKLAVEAAMEQAKASGAKRALPLPVSVPSHCTLMTEAANELFEVLEATHFSMPVIPVIHNQNAGIANSEDEIRLLLKKQLYQPVKWVDSVRYMHAEGIGRLIECGPGKVLSGLARRIDKSLLSAAVFDFESFEQTIKNVSEEN
ncbi:MAG: [acyl-carrier-protein] S-malonyltransferase [Gammaproteobacteria bacterium]|nr:MAG: [acyl-carrier-protein] S-malonyltransferase [Gammaproteobacteria bacterium]